MRLVPDGIDDQSLQSLKFGFHLVRNKVNIGQIGKVVYPDAKARHSSMLHFKHLNRKSATFNYVGRVT